MSKKKHPEHVNHERWLVSYADFITLLFAFFVVLFASGQSDKRKQVKLAQSMQSAFDHNGIFDPHSRTPPIADDANAIQHAVASPVALPLPSLSQPDDASNTADRIAEVVKKQIATHQVTDGVISVHPSPDGLVVSLREAGFFASGSADVRSESLDVLKAVASALPDQPMRIEGHTDNIPIHTAQFATNWELSTARAASITRLLIAQRAANPRQISAAGYAEFRPVADNSTEQGRAQNRRVDIILLQPANNSTPNHTDATDQHKK
jgi:chemotaxis protein MotB